MKLIYKNLKFDETADKPFVVFEDIRGMEYSFYISVHTATTIADYFSDKTYETGTLFQMMLDMASITHAVFSQINLEYIDSRLTGNVSLKIQNEKYYYSLNSDETIFLSILLNQTLSINPVDFTEFLDHPEEMFYHHKTSIMLNH